MANQAVTDLKIYKTVDDSSPQLGQTITWTIEVSNNGLDAAQNVSVSDLIPEGVSLVGSASASSGSFNQSSDTWSIGTMTPGVVETLTFSAVVDTVDHPIGVRSTVKTDTHDCDPDDNSHIVTVHPWKPTQADLHLTKSVNKEAPAVGTQVVWTLTVTNDGPDTAWNTVVRDELPEGLSFVRASADAFDAAQGQWNVGHLESGETAQLEIVTHVDSASGTDYVNRAIASSSTADDNPDNNTAEVSIDPVGAPVVETPAADTGECEPVIVCGCLCDHEKPPEHGADLQMQKWVSNPTPDYGSEVVWTLVVENLGPEDAENVVVNDTLPGGLEHLADSATMGEFEESLGIWNIGDLASGSSAVLQITTIAADAEVAVVNIAMVSSDTEDQNLSNNIDHAAIDAVGADLAIDKSVSDPSPNLGDTVTWTIDVVNNGPDTAENVVVADALPPGVTFLTASSDQFDAESGEWAVGNLAAGESATLSYEVTVDDAAGPRVNVAGVSSDTAEINLDDNTAQAQSDAIASDLAIEKTVSDEAPNLGDMITWTIDVINHGPDTAENVVVTDVLPEGVSFESASSDQFDADSGVWSVGDLPSGETATLGIDVTVDDADGPQINTASVTSDTYDDSPQNNSDDARTDAVAADLSIEKIVSDEAPDLGDTITWTISVVNNGPDIAENVTVTDALPVGVSFESASSELFDADSGVWSVGDLSSGESATLGIDVTVDDADGPQINIASVTSDAFDNNPDNNIAQAETDSVAADLELVKGVIPETAAPGDVVSWELSISNKGPDDATNVVVKDTLPAGVEFVADSSDGTTFDPETGLWMVGDLAAGDTMSLGIEASVTDTGVIVNTAQVVAADQTDPDSTVDNDDGDQSEDDEANATLTVPEIIDLELTQSISADTVEIGEVVTFTISVTNVSTVTATGVSVSTDLANHFESGVLAFSDSSDDGIVADPAADWKVGEVDAGETVTLTVDATVLQSGEIVNVAQVAAADQMDFDSTAGNYVQGRDEFQDDGDGDVFEDDEALVSASVPPSFSANPNALEVEGTGGASMNAVVVIDRSSSMKKEITIDGETKTRLDWNIEAVEEFASRVEVKAVKVIAFDGRVTDGATFYDGGNPDLIDKNHVPENEVSGWFDVTTNTDELGSFLESLAPWGSGTNYQAAIDATMAQADSPPNQAEETNYYFFSDGTPTQGGDADTHKLLDESGWQQFAEANFDNTYAVGFGGAISARDALEEIAHITGNPDDPAFNDDPNLLLVDEVDAIPTVLNNFADTSVSGNAIADDESVNEFNIDNIVFDGVTYSYQNGQITESGPSQGAILTNSFVVVDSLKEGSLQFDFDTGDFTYFAPVTDVPVEEIFEYTITDSEGASSTSTVTISVTPSPDVATPASANSAASADPTFVDSPDAVDVPPELPSTDLLFGDQVYLI